MPPPHYPSDLSDEECAILELLLSRPERRGQPAKCGSLGRSPTAYFALEKTVAIRRPRAYPSALAQGTLAP